MVSNLRSAVKVQLVGGLGNQMFCYAFGRYLENLGYRVIYDTSEVDRGYTRHGVFLESLNLPGDFQNLRKELGVIRYLLRRLSFATQSRLRVGNWPTWASPSYTAREVGWSPLHADSVKPGITMRGYFASYRYFRESTFGAGGQFRVKPKFPTDYFEAKTLQLSSERWLAVHVRRGDYVGLKNLYGLCGVEYFRRAYLDIKAKVSFARVVVFSDDIAEAKRLLEGVFDSKVEFLEPPPESGAEESLLLMSQANAHIISNSSFSLWAALLAISSEAVTYPHPWHKGMEAPKELLPPSWTPIGADFVEE